MPACSVERDADMEWIRCHRLPFLCCVKAVSVNARIRASRGRARGRFRVVGDIAHHVASRRPVLPGLLSDEDIFAVLSTRLSTVEIRSIAGKYVVREWNRIPASEGGICATAPDHGE